MIDEIVQFQGKTQISLPLSACSVPAGFPSPAEDWIESTLDLNELLVRNPSATFMMRVNGNSMIPAGIQDGAILVVDRSISPRSGMIVVAVHENGLTVKRYMDTPKGSYLHADNPEYHDIPITSETTIWGVVRSSIIQF